MVDKHAVGHRIKELRQALGAKQADFAKALNISRSSLSQIENGEMNASLDVIHTIVQKYDISYDYLLDGKLTPPPVPHPEIAEKLSKEEVALVNQNTKPLTIDDFNQYKAAWQMLKKKYEERVGTLEGDIKNLMAMLSKTQES